MRCQPRFLIVCCSSACSTKLAVKSGVIWFAWHRMWTYAMTYAEYHRRPLCRVKSVGKSKTKINKRNVTINFALET